MLKVVIADDKHVALYGLRDNINWERINAQVVGLALNGVEALEQVLEHKADILITDIQMPVMGGLELCKSVNDQMPDTMKIVISSYDYFEYAQKAIDYNVKNYILKPINQEKLLKIEELILATDKKISPSESAKNEDADFAKLDECEQDNYYHVISAINAIIKKEWSNPGLSVAYIAHEMELTQNYIGRIYKNVTGQKINDQIVNIRINKSKKMLKETLLPVNEISGQIGYENYWNFTRVFKNIVGMTPREYRNSGEV